VPLLHEGELPHNVEKQCVLVFSQIGWLSMLTPFNVLHNFGNIGALYLRFYYLKFGTQVH
jgi:hypothetical protein